MTGGWRAAWLVSGLLVVGGAASVVLCCGGSQEEVKYPEGSSQGTGQGAPASGAQSGSSSGLGVVGNCSGGAVLAVVRKKPLDGSGPESVVTVYEGGAFEANDGGQARTGCVAQNALAELRQLLANADFNSPPPPEARCMAMPTMKISLEHPQTGRAASQEMPCGLPVHPSVGDAIRAVLRATDSS